MDKQSLSSSDIGTLFFIASIILGSWFRLFPPLEAGFPINDGGLFYVMIKSVQINGYRLPEYIRYNGLEIPFAYPPLGFYVSGILAEILQTELLKIMQWLPAFVLITTIPTIFYLSNLLLNSKLKAGLATLIYSLLPRSTTWLIMGGGITRSFGQLFLILATIQIYLLFTNNQRKHLGYSILFSSLTVLTHPEATIHTLGIGLILFLGHGRSKANFIKALIVVSGTLLITMPWWVSMLIRFGLDPYISASQTGFNSPSYLFAFILPFSQEVFMPTVAIFAIPGAFYLIAKKEYTTPLLYAVPFFIEPRNAPNVSIIFMAILASVTLCDLILPALSSFSGLNQSTHAKILNNLPQKILLGHLVVSLILGMQIFGMEISEKHVSHHSLLSFEWIESNTDEESIFLVLTGETEPLEDFTNEWFPALTNRVTITTLQGLEWNNDINFAEHSLMLRDIQNCRLNYDIPRCIDALSGDTSLDFDYLVIMRKQTEPTVQFNEIPNWVNENGRTLIYSSDEVLVIQYSRLND